MGIGSCRDEKSLSHQRKERNIARAVTVTASKKLKDLSFTSLFPIENPRWAIGAI
jgi:hypothetical protein